MGLKCVPDFVQQLMEQVLLGLDNFEVYLDVIGFSATHGNSIKSSLKKSCLALKQTASPITPSSLHGLSKKPIGLDID